MTAEIGKATGNIAMLYHYIVMTCKTPACDVDGTAVEYHSGRGVSSRHAVYKPDDVNSDEYGKQRRRTDDTVGRQETRSRLIDRRRRVRLTAAVVGC